MGQGCSCDIEAAVKSDLRKVSDGSTHDSVLLHKMQQQQQLSLAAPAAHHNHHL